MSETKPPKSVLANLRTRMRDARFLLSLLVGSPESAGAKFYGLGNSFFTEKTYYLNLGYWKDSPQTHDEACHALSKLLADTAQLAPGDRILDVGFGFADQDIYWIEHYAPEKIVGINVTPIQVEFARKRIAKRKLEDRFEVHVGSATELDFEPESFDKVMALECAFHFNTRETFFRSAYRVLKPGGRIATADVIPVPNYDQVRMDRKSKLGHRLHRKFVPVPTVNQYPRDVYVTKLEEAGFINVNLFSIRDYVYPQFTHFLSQRLKEPETARKIGILGRALMGMVFNFRAPERSMPTEDYIIAVAEKPK
jgi:ubiquinone/menaquinone biosynthesis C-methylase UbiE